MLEGPTLPGASWAVRTTCCATAVLARTAVELEPGPHEVEVSFVGVLGAAQVAGTVRVQVEVPRSGTVRLRLPFRR